MKYSEAAQCIISEEVLLKSEHIRRAWKEPRVSLWQQSQRCSGCRQQMEPEQPVGWAAAREAALLALQEEMVGNSLVPEESQGSAALLEAWLSCSLCCWVFKLHNPREALGKPSSQGKSKMWAHHLSWNPVHSRAVASMDFIVLGDGCDGVFLLGMCPRPEVLPSGCIHCFFVFSSLTDKPSSVKNASMACAQREKDPWQRTWLLWP